MRRLLAFILLTAISGFGAAIPSTMVWELNASATAANANSGGFDIASGGLPTDLTCTGGTGNSADCTSATDGTWPTFQTGTWLWISGASGANWNINGLNNGTTTTGGGCFWPVTAATTHLTVNTSVGAGVCLYDANAVLVNAPNIPQHWVANTVAGIGVASPSSGTFGIDMSQAVTAALASNATLGATSGAPTTMTSTAAFNPSMVHNTVHVTTTGTGGFCVVGYYEITAYTSTSAVTTNATINNGTTCVLGTGSIGGAISLGTSTDALPFNASVSGNAWWMKNGTFSPSASFTITAVGTMPIPILFDGYNALRGDAPGANRPIITLGASVVTDSAIGWHFRNLIFNGTGLSVLNASGADQEFYNLKVVNASATTTRVGMIAGGARAWILNSEFISYRGIALQNTNSSWSIHGCYIHDSDTGIQVTNITGGSLTDSLITDNVTFGFSSTVGLTTATLINNTIYGAENKKGTGINLATGSTGLHLVNDIFYGLVSGIVHADTQEAGFDDYNDYFNNTTDVTLWAKGPHDIALTPSFASVVQTTGTGATSATNVLTDSAAHFNAVSPAIVNNQTFVYLSTGTGTGIALTKYLITTHTDTTLTLDSNITSSGSGTVIAYQLTTGGNFGTGPNLRGVGFPGAFPAGLTTGYVDIGGVEQQQLGNGGYVQ